jgi:hypothetical protein
MRRLVLVPLVLAGLAAPVAAQRSPDFATLDRGDGFSHIGLDLALSRLSPPTPPYDSALHVEVHAQYVLQSGLGLYGALPFAKAFGDGPAEGEFEGQAALGDLDVGGLYVIHGPTLSFVFRLGLIVPTASEDPGDNAANFWAQQYRLTDIAMTFPNDFFARLAFSPLFHSSNLFLRLDIGVDIPFAEDDEDLYRTDPIGRLNVGAGFDFGAAAIMLELANLFDIDDDDEDPPDDDDWASAGAITARFMGETLQPFISVGMPIDDWLRDRVDFFIAGGIQGVLH